MSASSSSSSRRPLAMLHRKTIQTTERFASPPDDDDDDDEEQTPRRKEKKKSLYDSNLDDEDEVVENNTDAIFLSSVFFTVYAIPAHLTFDLQYRTWGVLVPKFPLRVLRTNVVRLGEACVTGGDGGDYRRKRVTFFQRHSVQLIFCALAR